MSFNLKTISFRNFLSFGNNLTTIELDRPGKSVLIFGENKDNPDGIISNGSGKTTICNAITWALYDKSLTGISKERLINIINKNSDKKTQMEVILEFEKDGDEYKIHRFRGATNGATLYKNGEDISNDSNSTNKLILSIIGISYELFTYVIIWSGTSNNFLDMSVGSQRTLLEELEKITILSQKAELLKAKIKETDREIDITEAVNKQIEVQINDHKKQLTSMLKNVNDWEAKRNKSIDELYAQLSLVDDIDFEVESKSHEQIKSLTDDKVNVDHEIKIKTKSINDLKELIESLEHELTHLDQGKCPYCEQDYQVDESKTMEISDNLVALKEKLKNEQTQYDELTNKRENVVNELQTLQRQIKCKSFIEMTELKNNSEQLSSKLTSLLDEVNPYQSIYDELKNKVIEVDTKKMDELQLVREHQKFLLKLLTDKNSFIRKKIIDKSMPFLNNQIEMYLTKHLGLKHVVKFQSDMTCEITLFGIEMDHGNLSNGEKKKVDLAIKWAFRDVLFNVHQKFNAMFCDEIDSGSLDSPAVDSTIRLIREKTINEGTTIFVISHRPEFADRLDDMIHICKENGFSMVI